NEQPQDSLKRRRYFHDFYITYAATERLSLAAVFDVGKQQSAGHHGYDTWHTGSAFVKYKLSDLFSTTLRGEYYNADRGVLISTISPGLTDARFKAGGDIPDAARSPRPAQPRRRRAAGLRRNPRPPRHRGPAARLAPDAPQAGILQRPRGGGDGPRRHRAAPPAGGDSGRIGPLQRARFAPRKALARRGGASQPRHLGDNRRERAAPRKPARPSAQNHRHRRDRAHSRPPA
nr:hypothetical protein [Tanacetum cinerariifolium]